MAFDSKNKVGLGELNPQLRNIVLSKASGIQLYDHLNDKTNTISNRDRDLWDNSYKYAKQYTDYQFMSIIGNFNFADNGKTLADIVKEEIDTRTQDIKDVRQELKDNVDALNNTINLKYSILDNKIDTKYNDAVTLIDNETTRAKQAESDLKSYTDTKVATEATARTNADNSIKADLTTETNNRISADNNLSTTLNKNITDKVAAEATARTNADNAITTDVKNKYNTLSTKIDTSISTEVTNRNNAITTAVKECNTYTDGKITTVNNEITNLKNVNTTQSTQITNLTTKVSDGGSVSNANRVNGIRITIGTSTPSSPVNNGEIFINTANGKAMYYSNGWKNVIGVYG